MTSSTVEAAKLAIQQAEAAAANRKSGSGLQAWLPMLGAATIMPVLAYVTTTWFLIPQLQQATGPTPPEPCLVKNVPPKTRPISTPAADAKKGASKDGKFSVALSKILVNVAGSHGDRYLMTSLTLVGTDLEFKTNVEINKDQLLDIASGSLGSKTMSELERPGIRALIRHELITLFNTVLGSGMVKELYITEFAVQ